MANERRIPEHLLTLLSTSIESLDRLDMLLFLRAHRNKSFGVRAIASTFFVSSVFAEHHLADLCSRGFLTVSIGSDLLYAYHPATPALDAALKELEELNRSRRREIVEAFQRSRAHEKLRTVDAPPRATRAQGARRGNKNR